MFYSYHSLSTHLKLLRAGGRSFYCMKDCWTSKARPMFDWLLFNMAHFLAQPEARTLYANAKT
jgi:hypothetical protein